MEFLFTDKWASIEAIILLICLVLLLSFLIYEGYIFARRFYAAFWNKRVPVWIITPTTSQKTWEEVPAVSLVEWVETKQAQETVSEKPIDIVNEEEIYAEYVALVDETHAEKEKASPEDKIEQANEESTFIENSNSDLPIIEANLISDNSIWEWEDTIPAIDNKEVSISEQWNDSIHEIDTIVNDSSMLPNDGIDETVDLTGDTGQSQSDQIVTPADWASMVTEKELDEQVATQTIQSDTQNIDPFQWSSNHITTPPVKNHSETIFTLLNTIKTVMARWQLVEARSLIIQWLSLDKWNRELNLLLGSLYEWDRHFEKAEYVYKDLALDYPDDIEILEKLGNVLIIEKRYTIAHEIYKKILTIWWETEWTLYILSHLCHELNDAHEWYIYMKKYLKSWPNNPEILALISEVEVELWKRKDAIETLKRLKNLTPYNGEITATLQKLMMEEELAGNFWNQS
jgi:hypothetical protein